jgi:hypothetical protein
LELVRRLRRYGGEHTERHEHEPAGDQQFERTCMARRSLGALSKVCAKLRSSALSNAISRSRRRVLGDALFLLAQVLIAIGDAD